LPERQIDPQHGESQAAQFRTDSLDQFGPRIGTGSVRQHDRVRALPGVEPSAHFIFPELFRHDIVSVRWTLMADQPTLSRSAPVERFRCPGCSADMEYDPQTGGLKCDYCGSTQKVSHPVNVEVTELSFDEYTGDPGSTRLGRMSAKALEVTCSGCGSTIEFETGAMAGVCPFCAAKIVMQPKAADPLIAPNAILPFSIAKQQATGSVRQWLASLWFAPGGLKNVARPEGIQGIYVPFWTYDARTETTYRGARGDYYYETETVMVNQNGRTAPVRRQVRKTRWQAAAGRVANAFDDILVPATRSIDRKRLRDLDPWDLETVKPYEPAYLAGFQAQRYQIALPEGLGEAKQMMSGEILHTVRQDIGGDEQRVDETHTSYHDITFKHVLLPVWIGAYRFQGKVYQVTINARTGEVQGERPFSAGKIALLVAVITVLVFLLVLLARD
jgi:DNA-directed RNA polymerase subunit RPC12/RpoP